MPSMEVVVPDDIATGEYMTVETLDGRLISAVLPPGYMPGDVLPLDYQSLPPSPSGPSDWQPQKAKDARTCDFDVVVPDGFASGEIFAVETAWGIFDVTVPEGCGGGCAITCALPVPDDEAEGTSERPSETPYEDFSSDDYDFRYRPGRPVQVLRTDGSYSPAVIEYGFDGVYETLYCVRLASGLVKSAVPESEMYDANDANDPAYGEHLAQALAAMMEAEMMDAGCGCCCPYD